MVVPPPAPRLAVPTCCASPTGNPPAEYSRTNTGAVVSAPVLKVSQVTTNPPSGRPAMDVAKYRSGATLPDDATWIERKGCVSGANSQTHRLVEKLDCVS